MKISVEHRRIYAYIFDNILVLLLILLGRNVFVNLNNWQEEIMNNSAWYTWYEVLPKIVVAVFVIGFAMTFKGETLGKKIFKLKVVKELDKSNLSKIHIFIREGLFKYIPWVATYGIWFYIEVCVALFRKDNKTVHDIFTKTTVIDEKEYEENLKKKKEKKKLEIKTKANIKKKSK